MLLLDWDIFISFYSFWPRDHLYLLLGDNFFVILYSMLYCHELLSYDFMWNLLYDFLLLILDYFLFDWYFLYKSSGLILDDFLLVGNIADLAFTYFKLRVPFITY